MKSIQIIEPKNVKVSEVAIPQNKENEVLIKVRSAGVCGSDIGAYMGTNPLVSYPRIIGHEVAGIVMALPEGEKELQIGDHVIIEPYIYCGNCYPCSIGHTNCCENLRVRGVHVDGGMAEYVSHPRHLVLKVPKSLDFKLIPMIEPLVIGMHGITQAEVKAGEHVVITGAGPIGMLAAQYAMSLSAIPIMVDPVGERLTFCKTLGINHTINPTEKDVCEEIKSITKNRMAEAVIECSGDARAVRGSLDYVSFAGRISLVGWPKADISLPTGMITKKELTIRGSRNSAGQFIESTRLIAEGILNVEALISKHIELDEAPSTIVDIANNPGNYLKVIVNIN